jgi:hypothetical protein
MVSSPPDDSALVARDLVDEVQAAGVRDVPQDVAEPEETPDLDIFEARGEPPDRFLTDPADVALALFHGTWPSRSHATQPRESRSL